MKKPTMNPLEIQPDMTDITIMKFEERVISYKMTYKRSHTDKYGEQDPYHKINMPVGWEDYEEFLLQHLRPGKRYHIQQVSQKVRGHNFYFWIAITPINTTGKGKNKTVWFDQWRTQGDAANDKMSDLITY